MPLLSRTIFIEIQKKGLISDFLAAAPAAAHGPAARPDDDK